MATTTASRVGRNDPCPCGSGKKYKKCCLNAPSPEPAVHEVPAALVPAPPQPGRPPVLPPPREPSPEEAHWNGFWERFQKAPLAERLATARETISSAPDFDGELAFELIVGVIHLAQKEEGIAEAEALIDLIEERHPQAFAEEAHWFHSWRTENALLRPDGDVRTPLLAWAAVCGRNVEFFLAMLDRLSFHGRSDDVIAATATAWSVLRDDPDIIAPDECLLPVAVHAIIDRLRDSDPGLDADAAALWTALAPFAADLDAEKVREDVRVRAGRPPRTWQREDFRQLAGAEEDLYLLSLDFKDDLLKRQGWSAGRAELAREELVRALYAKPREKKAGQRGKAVPRREPLVPAADAIDAYLASLVSFFVVKPHRAAALALALPRWLSFLGEQGLADEELLRTASQKLAERIGALPGLLGKVITDPPLLAAMEAQARKVAAA